MKDCHVAIVRGECLQLVDRDGKPIPDVGMIGVPWAWRGALHAYQAPEPAPAASVTHNAAFQALLSDVETTIVEFTRSGCGDEYRAAKLALEIHVDAILAAARSAI